MHRRAKQLAGIGMAFTLAAALTIGAKPERDNIDKSPTSDTTNIARYNLEWLAANTSNPQSMLMPLELFQPAPAADSTKNQHGLLEHYIQTGIVDTLKGGYVKGETEYNWHLINQKDGKQIYQDLKNHGARKLGKLIGITPGIGGDPYTMEERLKAYEPILAKAVEEHNSKHHKETMQLTLEEVLAIAATESMVEPRAISPTGCMGAMMLYSTNYKNINPFDPEESIRKGIEVYAANLRQFKGSRELARVAYNRGPGTVAKALAAKTDSITIYEAVNEQGELIIDAEGRAYAAKVAKWEKMFKEYYHTGTDILTVMANHGLIPKTYLASLPAKTPESF